MASDHLREGKGLCFCALVLRQICIRPVYLVAFALYYICDIYQKKRYSNGTVVNIGINDNRV